MQTRSLLAAFFVLTCAAQTVPTAPPNVSVETLRKDYYRKPYNNEEVAIQGWVAHERRVVSKTYKGFHLRDRFGDIILVRTTQPLPEITTEIVVLGVALKDAETGEIFLSEVKREAASTAKEPPVVPKKDTVPQPAGGSDWSTVAQIGIGAVVVFLVVAAVILMLRRPATRSGEILSDQRRGPSAPPDEMPLKAGSLQLQDYATVKVYPTTKVLPGKLIVLENKKETDVIHLSDQSGNGEVEIGRDSPDVTGGIRVKDKTNTVSRKQAKLQYSPAAQEFRLTNLAGDSSNPTVVNENPLGPNQVVVLRDNDIVKMGNLELKFRSN
jgi:hypothetical protein